LGRKLGCTIYPQKPVTGHSVLRAGIFVLKEARAGTSQYPYMVLEKMGPSVPNRGKRPWQAPSEIIPGKDSRGLFCCGPGHRVEESMQIT